MVSFYKPAKKPRKPASSKPVSDIVIDELDLQGHGVSRQARPIMFVEGALPGETVSAVLLSQQKQVHKARLSKVQTASKLRQAPFCPLYEKCGGCQLQHIDADQALTLRQQAMDNYWQHQWGVTALPWQAPLTGPRPGYRRSARLAIDARDPKAIRIGFRQQGAKTIVDVPACPVLVPALQALLAPLRELLQAQSASRHLGHVHLLAGDEVCQLSLHATRDVPDSFIQALHTFGQTEQVNVRLSGKQAQTVYEQGPVLCQTEPGLALQPDSDDFIQVNGPVNIAMIAQAIDWLAPQADEQIADWFAGLGNFSLSLAQRCAQVHAVEGVAAMVAKGQRHATAQGITNIHWQHLDLSDSQAVAQALASGPDKMLLDPSREGAAEVCAQLAKVPVAQVLYVSCNPHTFTRDARELLKAGYQLKKIGLIEMFPYTRHLEVMALFTHAP